MLQPGGYRFVRSGDISGRATYKAMSTLESRGQSDRNIYKTVQSFAGEDRAYVEAVARYFSARGVRVFYDRYEEASLWDNDLAEHLDKVYRGTARYCVTFLSHHCDHTMLGTAEAEDEHDYCLILVLRMYVASDSLAS